MIFSRKTHRQIRLQNIVFGLLFLGVIGLLATLSTRYSWQSDWTEGGRNTLSKASQTLLGQLDLPIEITAYVAQNETLQVQIKDLVRQYQQHKSNVQLNFINPDTRPDLAREQGITVEGEMQIRYDGRRQQIKRPSEQELTNALQRLTLEEQKRVVFISGHGERSPIGEANHDYGLWGNALENKGFKLFELNLIENPSIPENTHVAVLADPQTELLQGEVLILQKYIDDGGHLLWLHEPTSESTPKPLLDQLGLSFLPGIIVDATTQTFGIDDPSYALVTNYPDHLLTEHLQSMSLFPGAAGIDSSNSDFIANDILQTLPRSWTEISPLEGSIAFDTNSEERRGPITLGVVLEATSESKYPKQRIAVIGDSDFLSNAFLGNGGNLDLGISLIRWLSKQDKTISIPAKTSPDTSLVLSETATGLIGFGFLFGLPVILIGSGVWIWYHRKRRT